MRRFTHTFPQRISAFLLCLALCLGLLPVTALAAGTDTGKAIQLGTSGISDPTSTQNNSGTYYTPSDYVYFGVKDSDPIKWRVLDADKTNDGTTSGMFLLSEYLLDSGVVFESAWTIDDNDGQTNPNEWQHSDAQNWCSTFATNPDVFSTAEQAAFLGVAKTDSAESSLYRIPWGASSLTENDKVFFLSARELADYVGSYDGAPGLRATDTAQSAGYWWLRSPNADYMDDAGLVYRAGYVDCNNVDDDWAARPAFNLNLNSVLFTSAAVGGKSPAAESEGSGTPERGDTQSGEDADGGDDGGNQSGGGDQGSGGDQGGGDQGGGDQGGGDQGGGDQGGGGDNQSGEDADAIFEIDSYNGNEWKLTLLDEAHKNFEISNATIDGSGNTIAFSYSGAQTGTNEYISVVLETNNEITHYGRILQLDGAANGESGTASLTLPTGVTLGDTTKLYVFNEQYNGDKMTDYASPLREISSPTVDTTAPKLSNGSATRTGENEATVKFTSDEAGSYYYAVVESGATEPTDIVSGDSANMASGENTINLTNLTAGAKDIYIVAKDAVNNVSDILTIQIPAYTYTLTVNLNGGSGSATGGEYAENAVVNIDAGSRSSYRFAGWTSSNGGTFADASSANTTFTMPAADTTITANWQYNPPYIPPTYAVTTPETTGGTVEVSPSRASSGRRVTITTQPAPGYELESLTVLDSRGSEIALTAQGDGKFTFTMPSRKVTVQASFAPVPLPFEDVPSGAWYESAVRYVYTHSIMEGTSATTFVPGKSLTRAEAVQIFYNLEGQPVVSESSTFPDLVYEWYKPAIAWAEQTGVVDGYEDGTFRPDQPVTRQEFAQMLYNYGAYKDYDLSAQGDLSSFPDGNSVQEWALPAMTWANGNALINGHDDGTLEPGGTTIRAQAASILMRFDQNLAE